MLFASDETFRMRHHPQDPPRRVRHAGDLGLGPIELALDERMALRALPARQRQLVTLVYFAGYRQEEVAEMLGISRGTVAKTLWEARCTLAHALVDYSRGAPS